MRKIYSLVLMTAMLFVGANAWAVTHTVSSDTELQDAWKAAQSGDVIQLTASFALTKTLWLGTANMSDTPMSLTLDLNGNALQFSASSPSTKRLFYITHGELIVTTSVPGGQIVYTGTPTDAQIKSSDYEVFRLTGSTYKNVNPQTATSGYYSHLTIDEGVFVKAIANAVTVDRLVSISGFSPIAAGDIAIPTNASGKYPTTETALSDGDKVPAALNTNVYTEGRGVANGVRIDISGRIEANKYAVKSNGNLGSPSNSVSSTRQYLGFKADANGTAYVVDENDINYSPFIHIHSTAELKTVQYESKKAVAAYSGGYARWLVEGTCIGSTGVYVKSGQVVLNDAVIASNYEGTDTYTPAVATNSGVACGGSGIVMESSTVYAGDIDVTVQGDTKVSATTGYAIDEAVTATDGNTKVDAITIAGGTFESGDAGTMQVTETTVEAAADPNQETVITIIGGNAEGGANLGGQTLEEFLTTQQGENAAYVTIVDDGNGGTTMVISQGEAPDTETNWDDIANLPDGSDANWTGLTPGIIGDGVNETKVTLGKLLINAGTSGNLQELTIKNNATLEVAHVVMNAYARITVEPGGKFIVTGDQGIVAPVVSNIVLKATETSQAAFLFKPTVQSNRHPNATVEFSVNSYTSTTNPSTDYRYQRFGVPTHNAIKAMTAKNPDTDADVQVFVRKFENNSWTNVGYLNVPGQTIHFEWMNDPFGYYIMQCNAPEIGTKVSMSGELVGNVDGVLTTNVGGWTTFSNSYSADMSLEQMMSVFEQMVDANAAILVQKPMAESDNDFQWTTYNLATKLFTSIPTVVNPLQAFLIHDADQSYNLTLKYKEMVYDPIVNPVAPAPARMANLTKVAIQLYNSNNVQKDAVYMIQADEFSSSLDKGYDAEKYLNSNANLYIMSDEKYASCATDDLENSYIGFSCVEGGMYTISFEEIEGENFAIVDLATNAVINMTEGATYQFYANDNETNDYRFQIRRIANVVTDVENVQENSIKSEGVYTITGQYLGTMNIWNTLPAGLYIVDGVKKVK